MTHKLTTDLRQRELAYRAGDGLEVTLFWRKADDRLTVVVSDSRTGDSFALAAASDNALDVFYHPYAYAASHQSPDGTANAEMLEAI